jgi:AmmeMemoRadiSam system protein A
MRSIVLKALKLTEYLTIFKNKIITGMLTDEDKKELLHTARMALIDAVGTEEQKLRYHGSGPQMVRCSDNLLLHCGAFVTLHRHRELRGCIGYITSDKALVDTVADLAALAAEQDPRFIPVSDEEIDDIDIEVSVLTPPVQISSSDEVVVGRDGLIIQSGKYRGLLLPQVATKYGWGREEFLEETCMKAGLPKDQWKNPQTKIYSFTAEVFEEEKK